MVYRLPGTSDVCSVGSVFGVSTVSGFLRYADRTPTAGFFQGTPTASQR